MGDLDIQFHLLFTKAEKLAHEKRIELSISRIVKQQQNRANTPVLRHHMHNCT